MSTAAVSSLVEGSPSVWLGRRGAATEVEVAVVGGGIVGLSTAYWLAQSGRDVLLLEAGQVAGRASGRNAGFLLTGSAEPFGDLEASLGTETAVAFWRLSDENRQLLRAELIDNGRVDCEFQGDGSWLGVTGTAEAADVLRSSAQRLADLGFDIEWREGDEVVRASGSPQVRSAIYQGRDGGLNPLLLCRGIAEVGGFAIRTGARVRAIDDEGEKVRLLTAGGDVVAERVVLALNAYAPLLVAELSSVVRPVRAQMLALEACEPTIHGVWYLNDGFEYSRQLADGTVLVGGCRCSAATAEQGYVETPTATVQSALERFVADTYPSLAGRRVTRRWAGTMAFTDDGLPRIGTLTEHPAVHYAVGFNGHGMSLGFVTGRYLARRLVDGSRLPLLPTS